MKAKALLPFVATFCVSYVPVHADLTKTEKADLAKRIKALEAKSTEAKSKRAVAPTTVEVREEFGKFFRRPYSGTLGLSLPIPLKTGTLYESHIDVDINALSGNAAPEVLDKGIKKLKTLAEGSGGKWITDYSQLGLGTSLGFENNQGNALLLRVRKQFQMLNEASDDAVFNYVDDRKAHDSGSRLEAAFMLDWYLNPLYNKRWKEWDETAMIPRLIKIDRHYRFWFRTGFEINKNDLPGKTEIDQQKWLALLNFQANPDQNARFLGMEGAEITSPQIVQIGAVYEQNRITGEDDWHWIVGWAPLFHLLKHDQSSGFGLNKRMFLGQPEKATIKSVVTTQGSETKIVTLAQTEPPKGWYCSINPSINALGASSARGIADKLAKIGSLDALEKLREEQLRWQVKALVGVNDGVFELSYTVNGTHPFSKLGDAHIGQEARADVNLLMWATRSPKDWHNLTAYVSYRRGQFEPNFEDIDLVTAGVSLRF